jgi:hypothetical protein
LLLSINWWGKNILIYSALDKYLKSRFFAIPDKCNSCFSININNIEKKMGHLLTIFNNEFSPQYFPKLALWLDASEVNTIVKDGTNKVSQWNDKSHNVMNLSQSKFLAVIYCKWT